MGNAVTTKAMADVPPHEMHGQCYGFAAERNKWAAPTTTYTTEAAARPGYDSMSASEYLDDEPTLKAKVHHVAQMVRAAKCCVVYAGAGLSTAAGIADYATRSGQASTALRSPMCAQPTDAHRVLGAPL